MEYDIPETENRHTFSMTTHGFDAKPGDTIFGHLALMDWGLEKYRLYANDKVVPILKKQQGFMDEIVLVSDVEANRVGALSFWKTREDAERYQLVQFKSVHETVRHVLEVEPTFGRSRFIPRRDIRLQLERPKGRVKQPRPRVEAGPMWLA
jgi:heme-degrading monooxygenase HmoA